MKKIFIIFIALVFCSTSVVAVEKFNFKFNLHENLTNKWSSLASKNYKVREKLDVFKSEFSTCSDLTNF